MGGDQRIDEGLIRFDFKLEVYSGVQCRRARRQPDLSGRFLEAMSFWRAGEASSTGIRRGGPVVLNATPAFLRREKRHGKLSRLKKQVDRRES